ncbi:MAG TPA: hypothetical protein VG758_08110 [Hyphomicrobiaceae bacterium]|jgi:hypothetical protein|nr:hypothetical protein [Hyphomicrobiaceae bacterium]
MLRNICVYTLMLGLGLAGAALARAQSPAQRADARELPTFELMGMPITPHQVQVVGSAHVQERLPGAALVLGGMPASPHQLAVLAPRKRATEAASAADLANAALPTH